MSPQSKIDVFRSGRVGAGTATAGWFGLAKDRPRPMLVCMIRLIRTPESVFAEIDGLWFSNDGFSFDRLFTAEDAEACVRKAFADGRVAGEPLPFAEMELEPPLDQQEIWAAGVTYYRSRDARMEESERAGGDRFYDLVYEAERPELFMKGGRSRCVGHRQAICVRSDSTWDVPEPEVALAVNAQGRIFGYTIGNDVSSRDIEGQNMLYLPQAKVWRNSCALGPALVIDPEFDRTAGIRLTIERDGETAFDGTTSLSELKRSFEELVTFLFRDNVFPHGAYLLTGTGVVPESDFTLRSGDLVIIAVEGLGVLANPVE